LKQRLAEQEALIHALQEKLSNREREIDHLLHSAVTIGCSVPNVKVMHRQKLRAGSMPGEKYTMYERHLF
ncbi:hypothetical protein EA188_29620, partial [Escherichia coli]